MYILFFYTGYENTTEGSISPSLVMSDEELRCKVGWAMAATFMSGVYQVNSAAVFTREKQ